MKKGTVKFFSDSKGFGFIIEEGTKTEYFIQNSNLNSITIKKGDTVEFETKKESRGFSAINIKII